MVIMEEKITATKIDLDKACEQAKKIAKEGTAEERMKNVIIESGMTLGQFAAFYEIPYGTVRQWYNGERKPPSYIIKLIKMAAKDIQMEIPKHYLTTYEIEEGHEVSARLFPAEWIARRKMNEEKDKGIKMHLYEVHEIY